MSKPTSAIWQSRVTILLAILILIPSAYGFIGKFVELMNIAQGDSDGAFALAPIMNYLLASLGFFCMLLWAAAGGMFRNIERPKHQLLEQERMLDRQNGDE